MGSLVDVVYDQHRRMFTLLAILEEQIDGYSQGEPFDTYVIEGVLDYVAEYPDRLHRPIELRLYEALRGAAPEDAALADSGLEHEHATLSAAARDLKNAVTAARRSAPAPKEWLVSRARALIEPLRVHMSREEEAILPACAAKLTPETLATLERELSSAGGIPRFEDEDAAYQRLYATVVAQQPLSMRKG